MTARRRAAPAGAQPLLPFAEFAAPPEMSPAPLPAGLILGTQGFQYDDWRGPFYPRGTRPTEMLGLYARRWSAVEIDSTFYAVPRASTVEAWRALEEWSAMIRAFLARAVQTYVFANNHYAGHSPATLALLRDRVVAAGVPPA